MRPAHFYLLLSSIATAGLLIACTQVSMPEAPEGQAFFAENCAACHGDDARGQTLLDLATRPADLTLLARENGGTFPRARALSYIWGDPDGGHIARVMPQFGPLLADDLVPLEVEGTLTPTPRVLVGVLAYLESIQR